MHEILISINFLYNIKIFNFILKNSLILKNNQICLNKFIDLKINDIISLIYSKNLMFFFLKKKKKKKKKNINYSLKN